MYNWEEMKIKILKKYPKRSLWVYLLSPFLYKHMYAVSEPIEGGERKQNAVLVTYRGKDYTLKFAHKI